MEYVGVLVVAALVFGICFGIDKLFTRLFRAQKEHKSGKAVRLNKRYGSMGLIVAVLGVAAVFAGLGENWLLLVGGCFLILVGIALVVYYMTFGIFYDTDSLILTTFGKKSTTYHYGDIQAQQLYKNYNSTIIELHMHDGRTVHLQSNMTGVYDFMDHAFLAWLRQTGRVLEDCPFYNPQNSCWFPPVEV